MAAMVICGRMASLFLRLDGNQPMASLPLLVRILPVRDFKKTVILLRRHFIVTQVIVGSGAKKITDRDLREKLGARIGCFDRECVVFVFVSRYRQIAISPAEVGLEFYCGQQFLLCFRELSLFQKYHAQPVMQFRVIRICGQQRAV